MPTHISLDVRYIVIRGDGMCRIFDTLYSSKGLDTTWKALAYQILDPNTILIPMDMFTAVRLGLVSFDELQLPEALRATINMIK